MKEIKMLVEYIEEELGDSEKYAKKALHYKDENKSLSDLFSQLSREEYSHFERLHEQAVKCINKHREEHGEPPAAMKAVWDYEHEKFIERAAKIRNMQNMAR